MPIITLDISEKVLKDIKAYTLVRVLLPQNATVNDIIMKKILDHLKDDDNSTLLIRYKSED